MPLLASLLLLLLLLLLRRCVVSTREAIVLTIASELSNEKLRPPSMVN